MNTFDAILKRRSIRTYKNKEIPKKALEKILKAAMYAPSAHNEQPWHFIVLEQKDLLKKMASICPYAKMAENAPLGIIVCADMNLIKTENFWPQDCAAATMNLLLSAEEHQIGSVWTAVYPKTDIITGIKDLFDLPNEIIPFSFVLFGYPDKQSQMPEDRYKLERIHMNIW